MARLDPLSLDEVAGLEEVEQTYQHTLGFVPNGLRIMARRPDIVRGFIALRRAVLDPASGTVPAESQEPLRPSRQPNPWLSVLSGTLAAGSGTSRS